MTHEDGQQQTTSRAEAVRELERIETEGAYAGLSRRGLERVQAGEGKITDLVFGVTRWRRWLDFLVDSFYSGAPEALELRIRIILRMGLYELLFTRVPDHAVVNEAVETARTMIGKRATGLVNGILRSVVRKQGDLPVPEGTSAAEALAIRYSHPTWMTERWLARYGESDTIRLLEHNNARPQFGLRVRDGDRDIVLARLGAAGGSAELSPFFEDFVRIDAMQSVFRAGLIEDGSVLVQDEAAGAVVRALDPRPGERILDTCAAPGGKALYLADLVGSGGAVVGVDSSASRLNLLDREARRLGLANVTTHAADFLMLTPDDLGGLFDRVLVDAPCSGLGVLSKRADLRWRMAPETLAELQQLQRKLIEAAARFVRPGGVLVYSTCTLEPEENEDQSHVFTELNGEYELQHMGQNVPGALVSSEGYLRSAPFEHGIDGAFAARFVRHSEP